MRHVNLRCNCPKTRNGAFYRTISAFGTPGSTIKSWRVVSPDSAKSHQGFKSKYNLPFPLLADEDKKICEAYGVWKEKSMYGRKYMGVERSTFLIGPDGRIQEVLRKVKVPGHVEELIEKI